MISRRRFVGGAVVGAAGLSLPGRLAWATPLGLPLGIQLYSVREQMAQDLDGALAAIAAAGYVEVEAAALPKKSAAEVRSALDKAGLKCVSAHHPMSELNAHFDEIVAYDKALGVQYVICSSPGRRTPNASAAGGHSALSLDDWSYNAEQFNAMGEKTAASSIRFGYHNHVPEFALTDGKVPYAELMRLTDANKVTFELDCGWAIVAGADPVVLLREHPGRISMLHVKDFTRPAGASHEPRDFKVTELGRGSIDYRPIFAQAPKTQKITHAFVEQESFDIPWKESLKVDALFLRGFTG